MMIPIIAGPCAAESREQILETARFLAEQTSVDTLRAGIWKPRSRPNSFEGHGVKALPWLQEARALYGLRLAVEVAQPHHVEACLKAGIDTLWLGARTVSNPFSVDELAKSLENCSARILVKNPMHPDLGLWIGALERLNNAGVKNIIALHRGFSVSHPGPFRNAPLWEIPIELKRRWSDLPIWIDPSHMGGSVAMVFEVMRYAHDLVMDGCMVEVHPQPEKAISDAQQQLSFSQFEELLTVCQDPQKEGNTQDLSRWRSEIDQLDQELLQILAARFHTVRLIGKHKEQQQLTVLQMARWRQVLDNSLEHAQALGLNVDFVDHLFQVIHQESIRLQKSRSEDLPDDREPLA